MFINYFEPKNSFLEHFFFLSFEYLKCYCMYKINPKKFCLVQNEHKKKIVLNV